MQASKQGDFKATFASMSSSINIGNWVVPSDVVGYTPLEFAIVTFLVRTKQLIRMVTETFNTPASTETLAHFETTFPNFPAVTDDKHSQMRYMLSDAQCEAAMNLYAQWKPLIEEDNKSLKEDGKESLLSVLDKHDVKAIAVLEKHVRMCTSLQVLQIAQLFVAKQAKRQLHYLFVMLKAVVDGARSIYTSGTPHEFPDFSKIPQALKQIPGGDLQAMLNNPELQKITNSPFMANILANFGKMGSP